jgi:hypothetical protein
MDRRRGGSRERVRPVLSRFPNPVGKRMHYYIGTRCGVLKLD